MHRSRVGVSRLGWEGGRHEKVEWQCRLEVHRSGLKGSPSRLPHAARSPKHLPQTLSLVSFGEPCSGCVAHIRELFGCGGDDWLYHLLGNRVGKGTHLNSA